MTSNYYKYGTNLQDRDFFTSTVNTQYGIKRYFSNIEGEIYFGNKLVEDIYKFDFAVEEKKLPIYGYNDFYATAIIPGQRLVQGTFVLNFTNGSYLNDILKEIDNSILSHDIVESEIYELTQDKRDGSIWPKSFDITIGYGYYKSDKETYNATCQTICGVQINNMQSLVDTSGEPIMEIYSFVAKDFINGGTDSFSGTSSTNNKDSSKEEVKSEAKQSYYYADKNNSSTFKSEYAKFKNDSNAISLLHNILFNIDKDNIASISVSITDFNSEAIKCSNVSLIITEQLDHNFISYSLDKVNDSKFTISLKSIASDGNIINEKLKSTTSISCTLSYDIEINSKKQKIEYNGYLYSDKKI